MLVLSRRERDTIRFPEQNITIQILNFRGQQVRVGVEAPEAVRIVRGELEEQPSARKTLDATEKSDQLRRELRNQLRQLGVGLHIYRERFENGQGHDANGVFEALVTHLEHLCDWLKDEEVNQPLEQTRA